MFSFKRACAGLLAAAAVLTAAVLLPPRALADDGSGGYRIDSYNVKAEVGLNNVLDVTERINADFLIPKHGIYRYIPVVSSATRQMNGKDVTQTSHVLITDVWVVDGETGDPIHFTKDREDDNLMLKIGDSDVTLTGKKTYVIHYSYDIGADNIRQFDDLYYNLIGNGWDTTISNVTFSVRMPKPFDPGTLSLTAGPAGSSDHSSVVSSVEGNTITGSVTRALNPGEGLTIRLELPDGYFVGARNAQAVYYWLCIIPAAMLLLSLFLFFSFGRDKKVYETVEVRPPEGVTSADAGYIIDGHVDIRDVVSLIIYWADKGYLSIESGKSGDFKLTKIRGADQAMKPYEKYMFGELFHDRETVSAKDLKDHFYQAVASTRQKVAFSFEMDNARRIFTRSGDAASKLCCFFAGICPAVMFCAAGYGYFFSVTAGLIAAAIAFAVTAAAAGVLCYAVDKSHDSGAGVVGAFVLLAVCELVIFAAAAALSGAVLPVFFACAAAVVCGSLASVAKKRTEQGARWLGQMLGLKKFIAVADKKRIEALVEEDPSYFYNILPYAYALGVTDRWAKQFEGIAVEPPSWYNDNSGNLFSVIYFTSLFNRNMNVYQTNMTSTPQRSSGSSGGGFGGGGFSGGGFGGGGGGSW